MVKGIETFREKFKDYPNCYTVIGGTACDILMSEADLNFRATKDIDMILILEDQHREFATVFLEYISSPSAILLNDDYYGFMMSGRKVVNGIGVLDAEHIIPFKMCAWLDLKRRKEIGEHVNERDLKKHKYDVFRLLQIVPAGAKIESSGLVRENIVRFFEMVQSEELNLRQIGLPFEKNEAVELLRKIYLVN